VVFSVVVYWTQFLTDCKKYCFMWACVVKCIHTNIQSKVQALRDLTTVSSNFRLLEHFCENFRPCICPHFRFHY
jgi:hypothetical protein